MNAGISPVLLQPNEVDLPTSFSDLSQQTAEVGAMQGLAQATEQGQIAPPGELLKTFKLCVRQAAEQNGLMQPALPGGLINQVQA